MTPEFVRMNHIDAVIFDLDSTLVTIEGIDELAKIRGVEAEVAAMTRRAMNGEIPFEDVFFRRLDIIKPTRADIETVGALYCRSITPGAPDVIRHLLGRNIRPFVISGGYNPAVSMVTRKLGIPDNHVFANELLFLPDGTYRGVNREIPLWKNTGKKQTIAMLKAALRGNTMMIGDSMSDLEAGADQFICFAGVQRREAVMKQSCTVVEETLLGILKYIPNSV